MAVEIARPAQVRDATEVWLAQRLRADSPDTVIEDVTVSLPQSPPSGQSNETLSFAARWNADGAAMAQEFILRRQPSANQLMPDPDILREFEVLLALQDSVVPAPRVRWAEASSEVQGVPFFVMERSVGTVPFGKPSIHSVGWLTTLTPEQRRRLSHAALDALIAIHGHPWQTTHRFLRDGYARSGDLAAQLRWLSDYYAWATRGRIFPVTDKALGWLIEHQNEVGESDPVLLWGDARVGNILFAGDLSVSAVLDWEFASIGPPELDVAYWTTFDEFLTSGSGIDRLDGMPSAAECVAHYREKSGRELADLPYYEVFSALFTATTIITQADIRVRKGTLQPNTTMGHGNALTQMLAARLGLPKPELSEDFLDHRQVSDAAVSPEKPTPRAT